MALPTTVDQYLTVGCMRCKLGGTPQCKVHTWQAELEALRTLALSHSLTETIKWGVPVYTLNNKNVLVVSALKAYCMISFFEGALLNDPKKLLSKAGEHSQAARLIQFTSLEQILKQEATLHNLIKQAIENAKAGKKSEKTNDSTPAPPAELLQQFKKNKSLEKAFYALTPGRQRGYLLYFTSAKQSATITARIEKFIPKILSGKGQLDWGGK